ncbi:CPBP family intramembrane glutamic endopeptidase [Robertmurraya andreesenii]|uniref:Membrane protease YdiL (CAAX protease family) n=1 Tax=Anoxybacillus andreesenii TaxID=1325932 RepID=A0ABT9UZJ0_9BACL|nr:CPBP family intramembrane glutamic endopeptidase [Robertmurraya andreesenii]MDQ0154116.1 membrane protease YdiL (CAAX protease family) [Robertmurraya andreesenii]
MILQKWLSDKRLILGILLAHLLLFYTFQNKVVFWYIFTATMLLLISYSILHEEIEDHVKMMNYLLIGSISGAILFSIFFVGRVFIDITHLPFDREIAKLYSRLSPSVLWHYIVLLLVIIPGEEIFWRGFIQKRIQKISKQWTGIFIASLLYASAHVYSGSFVLPLAALISGVFWGYLYSWKKSLPLVIVSHLIFDLFLFVIYPLN